MTYDKNISSEDLAKLVKDWSKNTFGATFKFRPHQEETINSMILAWLNDEDNIILDAPTGSGKSIIAITVAGVLSEYFGKTGYILISDLSLLEQYQNDITMFLPAWGVIRGQQTYTCLVNGLNFKVGACRLQGAKTYVEIMTTYGDCAPYCEYMIEREKAINAPVTCCTYSYWLLQQNYVKEKLADCSPFGSRDFVICDEAHKLVSIVQNHFSPRINSNDLNKFNSVIDASKMYEKEETKKKLELLQHQIGYENDKSKLYDLIKNYYNILFTLQNAAEDIKASLGVGKVLQDVDAAEKTKLTKAERALLWDCEFVHDVFCKFDDYTKIIDNCGINYIVKNDSDKSNITFNCLNESYLMHKAFHRHCKRKMYMSATIGDPAVYARETSIKTYKNYKLPVVFDYSKSPIFYVPDFKMSYNEKEYSFPNILKMIEKILMMYPDKRGIIQTGSYTFAKNLKENINPDLKGRILLYEDSATKQDNIEAYKFSTNAVLVGPSLIEGLSLNDDLCRFSIIMKIPYPSLADKFVAAKKEFNPQWYTDTTSISVLQGVGRGVRNENDWCITFILDGCFNNLLSTSRNMFPPEFLNRIQVIPSSSLL